MSLAPARPRTDSLAGDDLATAVRLRVQPGASAPARLLTRAAVAVAALTAMFGALAVAAAAADRALEVIGDESGPQIVATADLYFALSDADTQVATALLLGDAETERAAAAMAEYARLRGEIAETLLEAHRLAGAADTQRDTIESIMSYYGRYEQLAAEALLLADQTSYPAGAVPEEVLIAYRDASDLMQGWILPQAYNLTLENGTIVREAYDRARDRIAFGLVTVAVAGAAALTALVWLQTHLARAFRRVFNPSLLVATAVAALYLATGLAVLDAERNALAEAKTDGFDAALSLQRAKAISNSLHADQVRYLLDPGQADVYEQTYFDKAQQLIYVDSGNLAQYRDALEDLGYAGGLPGLLAGGLDGSDAGGELVAAYTQLQATDETMRNGDGDPAERLAPVEDAVEDYERALQTQSDRHLERFDRAIADGERAIADFAFLLPASMVALTVFVFTGIGPRVREFR